MSEKIVYAVTTEGVYRHAIVGVYEYFAQAEARARQCYADEPDNYHEFHVYKFQVGRAVSDGELILQIGDTP